MKFVLTAALLAIPAVALAQPTTAEPTTPTEWYTSVAGIIGVTALLVQVIKRFLGNVAYAKAVPTWLYAVIVSTILTFLAVRIWGTLPAPLWQTLTQAVAMAAAASGFYEWLSHSDKPLEASARKAMKRPPRTTTSATARKPKATTKTEKHEKTNPLSIK